MCILWIFFIKYIKYQSILYYIFRIITIFANAMENKKLISIRLEPDVLERIDDMAKSYSYRTRSSIINKLLSVVIKCSTDGTLTKMLSAYNPEKKGFVCKFEQKEN